MEFIHANKKQQSLLFNFQIFENDGFPQGICNNCIYRVQIAFDLKNQCVTSDFKLQQIFIPNDNSKPNTDNQFIVVNIGTDPEPENGKILTNLKSETDPLTSSPHSTTEEQFYDDFDLMAVDHVEEISSEPDQVPAEEIKIEEKPQAESCTFCGKTFSYSGYLKTHLRIHTGDRPFKCPYDYCRSEFAQAGNLQLHIKTHIGEKIFQCEICSKMCVSMSNLTAHRKIHTEKRDFKCHLCPKAFKVKQDLTNHVGTHSGVKNYHCKICDKSFYKVAYMNIHIRNVHEKEKRFTCKDCGKEFNNSSNFNCHVRIHTGERPYICKFASCNAKFNQSSALVRHRKQHLVNPVIPPPEITFLVTNSEKVSESVKQLPLPGIESINTIY